MNFKRARANQLCNTRESTFVLGNHVINRKERRQVQFSHVALRMVCAHVTKN